MKMMLATNAQQSENCPPRNGESRVQVEKVSTIRDHTTSQEKKGNDALGFLMPQGKVLTSGCIPSDEGEHAWQRYEKSDSVGSDLLSLRNKKLEELVLRYGCRKKDRVSHWMAWSGAENKKLASDKDYYINLVAKDAAPDKTKKQIELDLPRTFPKHAEFCCETSRGRIALRSILRAYAARNPTTGYLQSMNFVAGILLIVTNFDDENTFWLLSAIIEDMLPGFHAQKLTALISRVDEFGLFSKEQMPEVVAKLAEIGLMVSFRAPNWFLCLFVNSLPNEVVVRVWDILFYYSSEKLCTNVLMITALAIVKSVSDRVIHASTIADCARALQRAGEDIYDADAFIGAAFRENAVRLLDFGDKSRQVKAAHARIKAPATARKRKRSMSVDIGSRALFHKEDAASIGAKRLESCRRKASPKRAKHSMPVPVTASKVQGRRRHQRHHSSPAVLFSPGPTRVEKGKILDFAAAADAVSSSLRRWLTPRKSQLVTKLDIPSPLTEQDAAAEDGGDSVEVARKCSPHGVELRVTVTPGKEMRRLRQRLNSKTGYTPPHHALPR